MNQEKDPDYKNNLNSKIIQQRAINDQQQPQRASSKTKIQYLIQKRFNTKRNALNLNYCSNWKEVIMERDWSELSSLSLHHAYIQGSQVQIFRSVQFLWSNLVLIDLDCNNIGSLGAKIINKVYFPKLKEINIGTNFLGNQGLKHFQKSSLRHLSSIVLRYNYLTLDGYMNIGCAHWSCVQSLELIDSNPIHIIYLIPTSLEGAGIFNNINNKMKGIVQKLLLSRFVSNQ